MAFHMFCHSDGAAARRIAKAPVDAYLQSLCEAAKDWTEGTSSADYPGYDKLIEILSKETMESQIAKSQAWIGTPAEIIAMIRNLYDEYDGFEHASMQINFNMLDQTEAMRSLELFARDVIPAFS